jgi:ribose 5-phosphate isomerase B
MRIGIANDHRGYKLKKEIINYFNETGYTYNDYGADSEELTDYVDYAVKLCKAINNKEIDLGILICGTGIGMSIAANKINGIRCARVTTEEDAKLAKEHNMANVIAFGEDVKDYRKIVDAFIKTEYSSEPRHKRRVDKIMKLEGK